MENLSVEWIENNGSYEAMIDGERCGLVNQEIDDPAALNPKKWGAVWHTADGGLGSTGMQFDTMAEAKEAWVNGYSADRGCGG